MEVALREIPSQDVLRLKEEQTELDSVLGQAANSRLHARSPSQWTLNFAPGVLKWQANGKPDPPDKRASGLVLGLCCLKECANYLCNRTNW